MLMASGFGVADVHVALEIAVTQEYPRQRRVVRTAT